jgi:hypothetical protein
VNRQIKLWNKQFDFYQDTGREALLEAGIGYGKSMVASMWLFEQVQSQSNVKVDHGRKRLSAAKNRSR